MQSHSALFACFLQCPFYYGHDKIYRSLIYRRHNSNKGEQILTSFILKKLLNGLLLVFTVSVLVFSMMHLMPGDPVDLIVDRKVSQERKDIIRHEYGYDRPPYSQRTEPTKPKLNVEYVPLMRIRHDKFGDGTIIDVSGTGGSMTVTVDFDIGGKKRFAAAYAPLYPITDE